MAHSPQTPFPYQISGWDAGDDQCDLSIRVNGFRFNICVALENFVDSPKAVCELRDILQKINTTEDQDQDQDQDDDEQIWDFSEHIANQYITQFEKLAPPLSPLTGKITLADLAPRGAFDTNHRVHKEVASPEEFTRRAIQILPCPEWDMRSLQSTFPLFSPSEVEIRLTEPSHSDEIIPREVWVQGRRMYYKSCYSPNDALAEVEKYRMLAPRADLQISRLSGIVVDKEGQSRGLLYDWINTKGDGTLTAAVDLGAPRHLRIKWATQVRETVAELHKVCVIWGDAKPDNVLIDEDDNAIVIDLEGGTTRGWVDHDVAESIEGDLQGLGRLEHFVMG